MIDADNRKFFTYEKYYPQLIEFANTFNAEIFVVESEENLPIIEIFDLPAAFCNSAYKTPALPFEILETKISRHNVRPIIRKTADEIQTYVMKTFASGGIVSLKDLRSQFASSKLTTVCFCNHVRKAIAILGAQGIETQKVGAGKYKIKG